MTKNYWGTIILAHWRKLTLALIATTLAGAADPGLTRLAQGIGAFDKHDFPAAIRLLRPPGLPPQLADYAAYYLAAAEEQTNDPASAARDLQRYRTSPVPASPLAGKITLVLAKSLLEQSPAAPTQARDILLADYAFLPQPAGNFALATAYEATGQPVLAAQYYQKVAYGWPADWQADNALAAATRLKADPQSRQLLDRAQAWNTAKNYTKARAEFAALSGSLSGVDREEAALGIGIADYLAARYAAAVTELAPKLTAPTLDAQRLYYLTEATRRMADDSAMLAAIRDLAERYPSSPWRLKALTTAANRWLVTHDRDRYIPLFQAAAESFPNNPDSALAHWKITWDAWITKNPQRTELLREQVERYPTGGQISTSLYFLGMATEQSSPAQARACYERLNTQFQHYFYGGLARQRLARLTGTAADPTTVKWLDSVLPPANAAQPTALATAATRTRLQRLRLLIDGDLADSAIAELDFAAKQTGEQPIVLAMELANAMPSSFRALKIMKRFSGDYLALPFDSAPRAFWELLFPLPYSDAVMTHSTAHDLDPMRVAGLIRQESEFNPTVRSGANAYGLMQLIPSTGKALGRKEGIKVNSAAALLNPALNIQLGTQYVRSQLQQWDGDWTRTLAAYNAGPTRVKEWLAEFGNLEGPEFIESIPFTETRDYVQAVLRNGEIYRAIYGKPGATFASASPAAAPLPIKLTTVKPLPAGVVKKKSAKVAAVKKPARKRSK